MNLVPTGGATTGMKAIALIAGVALLGIGQADTLERGWVSKISGASLLGLGLYWVFAAPAPDTQAHP